MDIKNYRIDICMHGHIFQELQTNVESSSEVLQNEAEFVSGRSNGVTLRRGELFGEFNLGSTVVLIFEAPSNFMLRIDAGDKVRFGQGLTRRPKPKQRKRPARFQ